MFDPFYSNFSLALNPIKEFRVQNAYLSEHSTLIVIHVYFFVLNQNSIVQSLHFYVCNLFLFTYHKNVVVLYVC